MPRVLMNFDRYSGFWWVHFIEADCRTLIGPKTRYYRFATRMVFARSCCAAILRTCRSSSTAFGHGARIPQAGFHAFRHFNVSLLDALRVPVKTIQERAGHALTGVFTLDVYGGSPEWDRNLEAGRSAGSDIEKAMRKLENECNSAFVGSLSAIDEKGSGATIS